MIIIAPSADGGIDLEKLSPTCAGRNWTMRSVFHVMARTPAAPQSPAPPKEQVPRFAPEGDVVVEIDQVKPGLHVFAFLRKFADVSGEVLKRFNVTARAASFHECAPGLDLPCGSRRLRIRVHPGKYLPIAGSGRELLFQGRKIEPHEFFEVL